MDDDAEMVSTLNETLAENRALRAECDALRAALRKRAIFGGIKKWRGCDECKGTWNEGDPAEQHAEGCLAAPRKEGERA